MFDDIELPDACVCTLLQELLKTQILTLFSITTIQEYEKQENMASEVFRIFRI